MLPWSNQKIIARNNLKIEEILILNFIKKRYIYHAIK
jgi:hypothetical protein